MARGFYEAWLPALLLATACGDSGSPTRAGARRSETLDADDSIGPVPSLRFRPRFVHLGSVRLFTTSAPRRIELINGQTGPLAIVSVTASGDFAQTNDCAAGIGIVSGGSCTIEVVFTPQALGEQSGTLTVVGAPPCDGAACGPVGGGPAVTVTASLAGQGSLEGLESIEVTPADASLPLGNRQSFTATGHFEEGAALDLTSVTKWGSSMAGVATISNVVGTQGVATGAGLGATLISASAGERTGSTLLTVTPPPAPQLSPPALDFKYQMVGAASTPATVTATNVAMVPITLAAIVLEGADASDFAAGSIIGLPLTLAPGASLSLAFTFRPAPPWRPGNRTASVRLVDDAGSGTQSVALTGMGVGCLGPVPACSSGCADSDGDGLNDAWEAAGGVDLNNDGVVDAQHDLLLPGADVNNQDLYVQYDWMDWGLPGNACNLSTDCASISAAHAGETCTGPQVLPTSAGSCAYACTTDPDCAARGRGHLTERCVANSCVHTHDPDILAPGALQAVVDSFAAHGIALHLIRGHALPPSLVTSFRQDGSMTSACEGADPAGGVGIGQYAVSLYDLKAISSFDPLKIAYHYSLFSHYSGCDTQHHCDVCPYSINPDGSPKANSPVFGESGLAEVSGNDFIVSLGERFSDLAHEPGTFDVGSTFMHELGHNLGLRHGGGIDTPCETVAAVCPAGGFCTATPVGNLCLQGDDTNAKPNYLSVMNYRYQFTGIQSASVVGSAVPISTRLDYSSQILPSGGNTPGYLDQSNVPGQPAVGDPGLGLDEPAGLGSGNADIFSYSNGKETGIPSGAATEGPVDWSGNGDFEELHVLADTNCGPAGFGDHLCTTLSYPRLVGHTDWGPAGLNNFTYKFQCTPFGGLNGDGSSSSLPRILQHEMSTTMAIQAHLALPIRPVGIVIAPDTSQTILLGSAGELSVALLGSQELDVAEVDQSSLRFHGASAFRVEMKDVNGDGKLDLLVFFHQEDVRLPPLAKKASLTGWLLSSQAFVGEDRVRILK